MVPVFGNCTQTTWHRRCCCCGWYCYFGSDLHFFGQDDDGGDFVVVVSSHLAFNRLHLHLRTVTLPLFGCEFLDVACPLSNMEFIAWPIEVSWGEASGAGSGSGSPEVIAIDWNKTPLNIKLSFNNKKMEVSKKNLTRKAVVKKCNCTFIIDVNLMK